MRTSSSATTFNVSSNATNSSTSSTNVMCTGQRQMGNAVPSLIAEILGREIRTQLLDRPIKTPLKLLPTACFSEGTWVKMKSMTNVPSNKP
jgi:hypothetical protein